MFKGFKPNPNPTAGGFKDKTYSLFGFLLKMRLKGASTVKSVLLFTHNERGKFFYLNQFVEKLIEDGLIQTETSFDLKNLHKMPSTHVRFTLKGEEKFTNRMIAILTLIASLIAILIALWK